MISLKRRKPVSLLWSMKNTSIDHLSPKRLTTCLMGQAKYSLRVRSSRLAHLSELDGSHCFERSALISAIICFLKISYGNSTKFSEHECK